MLNEEQICKTRQHICNTCQGFVYVNLFYLLEEDIIKYATDAILIAGVAFWTDKYLF